MFLMSYSSAHPKFKVLKEADVTDAWYRPGGLFLTHTSGVSYVTSVVSSVKRSIDRGGIVSVSSSLEKDMRYVLSLLKK
jgi:hypothetical protein